ncbi:MAG: hypothetical protein M3P43_00115 [Actinomycetota bacterium]|nr:hypothetical protein [Actinomycetota bacterium]
MSDLFTKREVLSVGAWLRADDFAHADDSFRDRWEARQLTAAEVAQLRALFAEYLDRADISRRNGRGGGFDPARVAITWLRK